MLEDLLGFGWLKFGLIVALVVGSFEVVGGNLCLMLVSMRSVN